MPGWRRLRLTAYTSALGAIVAVAVVVVGGAELAPAWLPTTALGSWAVFALCLPGVVEGWRLLRRPSEEDDERGDDHEPRLGLHARPLRQDRPGDVEDVPVRAKAALPSDLLDFGD